MLYIQAADATEPPDGANPCFTAAMLAGALWAGDGRPFEGRLTALRLR
jgi:hypothetical protein